MRRLLVILMVFSMAMDFAVGQTMTWSKTVMDGSRTGCRAPGADDVTEALGSVTGGVYAAPSGAVFRDGCVVRVAKTVLDAQPAMAPVKKVVGRSARRLSRNRPESPLTNMFADVLLAAAERLSGEKVDVSAANFGGVRASLEEGDIQVDDIATMFPFKNWLCLVYLKGSTLKDHLQTLASHNALPILGGVRLVVEDGVITSFYIGDEPLDENKTYKLSTISFLLNGGDGMFFDKGAIKVKEWKDVMVRDLVMDYVKDQTAQGKMIDYQTDGRVVVIKHKEGRR